jgi:hypothetical protein
VRENDDVRDKKISRATTTNDERTPIIRIVSNRSGAATRQAAKELERTVVERASPSVSPNDLRERATNSKTLISFGQMTVD